MTKLTYEQLRHLASLGDPSGQLAIKNRKGKVVRPNVKTWGPKTPKEITATHYTSTTEPQRQCPVPMASHSQTYRQASSLQLRRPAAKR